MKQKLIPILAISLVVSIACNLYQGVNAHQKTAANTALSKEQLKLTGAITTLQADLTQKTKELSGLQEKVTELELQIAEHANQKEKYWTLAVEDYLITLQEGEYEDTLDLMYDKEEKQMHLLTFQKGNDYIVPTDISAEAFENCLGHSGFRLYKRHPLGTLSHYYEVDYYAVEDELEFLAYRWGAKDDAFYEVDIDGDDIKELVCNVVWMADGAMDVLIYHFNGKKVMRAHGSDLLDQPVDNHGVGAIATTYLPDKGKVHIDYWQDALQGYAEKEYPIVLEKMDWVETYK